MRGEDTRLAVIIHDLPHLDVIGQLVCNVAGWTDTDVWDVEDEQLLDALRHQQGYERVHRNSDSST